MRSYGKIYNFGHKAIENLFDGEVIIEEKFDGSQFSFGKVDGELFCRSQNVMIDIDNPDSMFSLAVDVVKKIKGDLKDGWTYRGEYLQTKKHNTLHYDRVPKNHIGIFDIDTGFQSYMPYDDKKTEALRLGFEVTPLLFKGLITEKKQLDNFLNTDSVLGGCKIEGYVMKNYTSFGKDKKCLMGKTVCPKFIEAHNLEWKRKNPNSKDILTELSESLRTDARWNKSIQHLKESGELLQGVSAIGQLMKAVKSDIKEECADMIKDKLFEWAWKSIGRSVVRGFPEWYKEKLVEKQFEK